MKDIPILVPVSDHSSCDHESSSSEMPTGSGCLQKIQDFEAWVESLVPIPAQIVFDRVYWWIVQLIFWSIGANAGVILGIFLMI